MIGAQGRHRVRTPEFGDRNQPSDRRNEMACERPDIELVARSGKVQLVCAHACEQTAHPCGGREVHLARIRLLRGLDGVHCRSFRFAATGVACWVEVDRVNMTSSVMFW